MTIQQLTEDRLGYSHEAVRAFKLRNRHLTPSVVLFLAHGGFSSTLQL